MLLRLSRLLTIVGGARDALVVGRGGTQAKFRPRRAPDTRSYGPSTSPLAGGSVCHRRCKCPIDSCAGCDRSRRLLSNPGCFKRQTPSVDTCRCVPDPEHPRVQLPISISSADTLCAGVFLVTRIHGVESLAADNSNGDLRGCAAGAQRCLSTVAFRTRRFEARSGVDGYSHAVCHGGNRTSCGIRYLAPGYRRVFPWSGRSVGRLDRIGSSVPVCATRRLTTVDS